MEVEVWLWYDVDVRKWRLMGGYGIGYGYVTFFRSDDYQSGKLDIHLGYSLIRKQLIRLLTSNSFL